MCLEIKTNTQHWLTRSLNILIPKKAKKDIICYKIYKTINETEVKSIKRHTYHILGIQPKVKFTYDFWNDSISINAGYHSYIKKPNNNNKNHHIYKCIIPKGAKYFIGGINDILKIDGYVSNQLEIIEKVNNIILPKDELL